MTLARQDGIIWLHIAAFLSGKANLTKVTYLGVLKEFLSFLHSRSEFEPSDFDRLTKVTSLDAARYLEWLRSKPGIKPREHLYETANANTVRDNKPKTDTTPSKKDWSSYRQKLPDDLRQSPASIRKKVAILRKLYKVLQSAGLVKANPFATELLTLPKSGAEKRPTEMVDFKIVRDIIDAAKDDSLCGHRDSCLLAFLFGLGLRRSEAVKILMTDFRTSPEGTQYVRLRKTKSGKDDILPINSFVEPYLQEWLNKREEAGVKSVFLFPAVEGKHRKRVLADRSMSTSSVWRVFKNACRKLGLSRKFSPHSARATAITKLLAEGWDFKSVQSFSRHSSITMVERYDKRRIQIEQNPGLKLRF